jgi:hypothetical protein
VEVDGEVYTAVSRTTHYLKLFHGICDDQYATDGDHCVPWDNTDFWKDLDDKNKIISQSSTNFSDDAQYTWPAALRIGIVCLVLVLLAIFLLVYALIRGDISWEYQMGMVAVQVVLVLVIGLHLCLGLITTQILPTSYRTYHYGCDVYTGPGAAWWGAVLAMVMSAYVSVLLLFPYLMGPLWVNHIARVRVSGISPGTDGDEDIFGLGLDPEEEDFDEEDPYGGLPLGMDLALENVKV